MPPRSPTGPPATYQLPSWAPLYALNGPETTFMNSKFPVDVQSVKSPVSKLPFCTRFCAKVCGALTSKATTSATKTSRVLGRILPPEWASYRQVVAQFLFQKWTQCFQQLSYYLQRRCALCCNVNGRNLPETGIHLGRNARSIALKSGLRATSCID